MIVAGPTWAQTEQVRRGPVPTWATPSTLLPLPATTTGPVFFRRQDVEVHLSEKGQAQYLGYRIKLLDPAALQLGNISIAWNAGAGAPIAHGIKVIRDGQVVDVLKDATFEILRREDQLEAAKLDGTLTAVLRVPDLRVGDELEVDMTVFSIDMAAAQRDNGRIAAFDNSMGWISYDPAGKKTSIGNGETVPMTYDFDWIGPDVPCRAADTR